MIDTIKIAFPVKSVEDREKIERKLQHRMRVDGETAEIISIFTQDSLKGTWDSRISCHISDMMHKFYECETSNTGDNARGRVVVVPRERPICVVECSLAKFLFGTNIFNYNIETAIRGIGILQNWVLQYFDLDYEIDDKDWLIERVDIAKNYLTNNSKDYFTSLRYLSYPRRQAPVPYPTGIYFSGARTTFKIYDKKAEFLKHDVKRFNEITGNILKNLSENVVRFEVELHKKFLVSRDIRTVEELKKGAEMIKKELDETRKKCMIGTDGRITREEQVLRFCKSYNWTRKKITADAFFAYWVVAATQGDARAAAFFGPDKRKRVKHIMKENGISFLTDINLNKGVGDLIDIEDVTRAGQMRCMGNVPALMLLAA